MFALRVLRKHWRLTATAVFSLSVAMALGVLSLSISNTALLLPPAGHEPERLIMIHGRSAETGIDQISWLDYQFYRQNSRTLTDIAAAPNSVSVLTDLNFGGREVKTLARPVSSNYFSVLGIQPWLGRFFASADDETNTHSAVMTYSCWTRLGADTHIVGKRLGGYTIIGVAPKTFTGSFYGLNGDLLTQLGEGPAAPWLRQRDARRFFLIARLQPRATRRQAQTEMAVLAKQLADAFPKEDRNRSAVVTRATLLPPDALRNAEMATGILMALVLLVLMIACANVANLLLALAVGRRQEAAIKLALGAPRGRLIREFLRESTALCAASALLGYVIAAAVIARFSNLSFELPMVGAVSFGLNLRLDVTVIGFTVALMLMASLAAGLSPALYASSPDIALILSGEVAVGGFGKAARRNALAVIQVAVCTLVLIGLGLCRQNLYNLRHTELGFTERNLVAMGVYPSGEGYSEARGKEMYEVVRKATAALPGVKSVGLASDLPLFGGTVIQVQPSGGEKKTSVSYTVVDPGYFSTIGLPILQGRGFNSTDIETGVPTLVINRKMAESLWPGKNPLGSDVQIGDLPRRFTVVGVAADSKYDDLDEERQPFMYFALSQHYQGTVNVIAKTDGNPRLWVEPLDHAMRTAGFKAPMRPVTFDHLMNLLLFSERIATAIVAALSLLGFLLAAIGLSGAVSYSVSQRKRELGIRSALGAGSRQLMNMILRQILPIAATGVSIGILLGIGATVLLRSQFYGIAVVEWTVLLPVAAAMLAVSLAVAYVSARPWIRVDPMEAVRHN